MQINKTETMWPEKIAAIYAQFPWLEMVFPASRISRVYVKRFDETTLGIQATAVKIDLGMGVPWGLPVYRWKLVTSVFFVNEYLCLAPQPWWHQIGKTTVERRTFLFLREKVVEYYEETIGHAVQCLPSRATVTHVVVVHHGDPETARGSEESLNRLTVYKSPKDAAHPNGTTQLRQWYDARVAEINTTVKEEADSV